MLEDAIPLATQLSGPPTAAVKAGNARLSIARARPRISHLNARSPVSSAAVRADGFAFRAHHLRPEQGHTERKDIVGFGAIRRRGPRTLRVDWSQDVSEHIAGDVLERNRPIGAPKHWATCGFWYT
jgi:hypothetical protein